MLLFLSLLSLLVLSLLLLLLVVVVMALVVVMTRLLAVGVPAARCKVLANPQRGSQDGVRAAEPQRRQQQPQ